MISIPSTADIRMHVYDGHWIITIAPSDGPQDPLTLITRRGHMSAQLTFDEGVAWPDKRGVALANAMLEQPSGAVLLTFTGAADAINCRDRLRKERLG